MWNKLTKEQFFKVSFNQMIDKKWQPTDIFSSIIIKSTEDSINIIKNMFNGTIMGNGFSLVVSNRTTATEKKKAHHITSFECSRITKQITRIAELQVSEGSFFEQRETVDKILCTDLFGGQSLLKSNEENPGLYTMFFGISNVGLSATQLIKEWYDEKH